jgi:peptide/nickel transport system substrate-binding protein
VHLSHPHATLLTDLEVPVLRADQASGPPDPCGAMDGLGPYVVTSCVPGAIALVPAPNAARPAAHAVTIRTVHDENARAMRLYAGRADVALNQISPTLLPAMTRDPGLAVVSRPGANLTYLLPREGRGPVADAAVRRAISLAIDRRGLTDTLLAGHAQPADGIIPRTHWAYVGGAPPLSYDPAAARALLAGPVSVTLIVSPDRLRVSLARCIAQELADVGVRVDVVPLAIGTLFARLAAGDFDLAMLTLPEMTEPHVYRYFLHSAFAPPAGANRGRVADPELDALLEAGAASTSADERRAIYAKASARVVQEMHVIPLWQEDQVAVTSERARAFIPSAEGRWLSLADIP